ERAARGAGRLRSRRYHPDVTADALRPAAAPRAEGARKGLLLLAGSTFVGLFFATQAYWNPAMHGLITWRKALAINLVYYCWAGAAVPLVVMLARRFRFDAGRIGRSLLVHTAASAGITLLVIVATEAVLVGSGVRKETSLGYDLPFAVRANFHSLLPTYWMI